MSLPKPTQVTLSAFICLLLLSAAVPLDDWELARDKAGIQVYTRKVEGNPLKEYKAVTTLPTTLEAAVGLLRDVDHYSTWVYNCEESHVVKRLSSDDFYVYYHIKSPWPIADRDMVIHVQFQERAGEVVCRQTNAPTLVPEVAGRVRLPVMDATWEFIPQENGEIKISQRVLTAPGGSIPGWLANAAVVDAPFESFTRLRAALGE